MNSSTVIIFVKAPIPGKVKTRLAASIGPGHAVNLYRCFVKDTIRTAKQACGCLNIFYDSADASAPIQQMLGDEQAYQAQCGKDLGEKMANAFCDVFAHKITRAVLVGSDIPDLPEKLLIEAITELNHHDAVIGPSSDGGYYLIGFRSDTFCADIFSTISWSTDTVCADTLRKLFENGLDTHILPQWRDVDTYENLMDLADDLLNLRSSAQSTHAYLTQMLGEKTD
jgi:rSAM/selenodomain-associated transferase 1